MLTRRALAKFVGAAALGGGMPLGLAARAIAQSGAAPRPRGAYLIKNGAVVTVDQALGTLPRADVLVRDGRIAGIGPDLAATDAEVIDATDMIVMPGFVDTHYHPQWLTPNVHTNQVWQYLAELAYGTTTTRDPQTASTDFLSYGDRVETGEVLGPRIYTTGPGVFNSEQNQAEFLVGITF